MANVIIDGRTYDMEALSEAARQQVMNIAAIDQELRRLRALVGICETARKVHLANLQGVLSTN